jgi:hypothetical protein
MVTRATGGISVRGLCVPADPGAADEKARRGMLSLSFGKLWEKVRSPHYPPLSPSAFRLPLSPAVNHSPLTASLIVVHCSNSGFNPSPPTIPPNCTPTFVDKPTPQTRADLGHENRGSQ